MRFDTPFADRVTAVVFFALGAAMVWGGYVMDRLEIRQIHPASIPGLVPMILGVAMMLCAVLLATSASRTPRDATEPETGSWGDFAFTAIWSCIFALVLVGRIPFSVATALYIVGFVGWFLIPAAPDSRARIRIVVLVILFGVAVSAAVSVLFRYGFLVRLP